MREVWWYLALLCAGGSAPFAPAAWTAPQAAPPWSHGANDPAPEKGVEFHVADIDNVPDLHGDPARPGLVLLVGGNQFFVLPQLISIFERLHPELRGRIFYETLPPGILRRQIDAGGVITIGNLTLRVEPDVYEAGARVLHEMEKQGKVHDVVTYAANDLEIMVAAGNPKGVASLNDLGRADLRLAMPNPAWEGVASQIEACLRKAGGEPLYRAVYEEKVASGKAVLTEIHHRQTPMRIMSGQADAGVTWSSEVVFQRKIGNPIDGVPIPAGQNVTGLYAAGVLRTAPHSEAASAWVRFLGSPDAQRVYHQFGFRPVGHEGVGERPATDSAGASASGGGL
jgi:ABC-type molybdate transport system substrate-binding protein